MADRVSSSDYQLADKWGWWANGAADWASASDYQSADSGVGGLMG